MMNAAGTQTALRNLEATPFAKQQILGWNQHIGECHLCMAVRGMIIAVNRQEALHLDTRRLEIDQDHRLLTVDVCLRVGLSHQDRELASRVAGTRRPPFAPVDDIMVAIPPDRGADVGGIGRGDIGFGHEECGTDFAIHQRPEPAILMRPCPVAMQDFHVPGIGSRAIEDLGSPADPAHLFGAQGIFEIGEALPGKLETILDMRLTARWRHEQVPQAGAPGAGLEPLDRSVTAAIDRHARVPVRRPSMMGELPAP